MKWQTRPRPTHQVRRLPYQRVRQNGATIEEATRAVEALPSYAPEKRGLLRSLDLVRDDDESAPTPESIRNAAQFVSKDLEKKHRRDALPSLYGGIY